MRARRLGRLAWNSAPGLLLITGGLFGLTLPFGKIATAHGVTPLVWAFVVSFGAGAILFGAVLAAGRRVGLSPRNLRYFALAGTISYAIPNLLLFSAIPHLGAGYAGIMFTLSPVVTLALSMALGVRRPNALGVAGIAVGFLGALIVATTRGEVGRPAGIFWVAVGLCLPLSLAFGNIYRTWDWPKGAAPLELAIGSHLFAAGLVLAALAATGGLAGFGLLAELPGLTFAQALSSAGMFAFFFRLQAVGGPVYLSQIGYIGAAVALASGTLFLGESYHLATWAGAGIIVAGVVMTTKAQAEDS